MSQFPFDRRDRLMIATLLGRIDKLESESSGLKKENAQLRRENTRLSPENAELKAETAELKAENSKLKDEIARLKKNSSNSSKPPSSDMVKPPKPAAPGRKKRKIGGQIGHQQHLREAFTPEQITRIVEHSLKICPDCGGEVTALAIPPRVRQQAELLSAPLEIVEHRSGSCRCRQCGKVHQAPLPAAVENGGLTGPQLTTFIAYLKGVCHASFSTIRKLVRDVLKLQVSRGFLAKVIGQVSDSMRQAYDQLEAILPQQETLNVDETSHRLNGEHWWTWCFRARDFTVFAIEDSRSSDVLEEILGEAFKGTMGCDYYSAYRSYMGHGESMVKVQFCLAHLIRDVRFLAEHPDKVTANYGKRVLAGLRNLFRIIHRREKMSPAGFERALENARDLIIKVGRSAPARQEAENMAQRFKKHGDSYFRFITTPGIEPTNNLAEQAIRFVVIDRLITQGTRSVIGNEWSERIWTIIATCTQQGRNVYEFIHQTIEARLNGHAPPSLVPE